MGVTVLTAITDSHWSEHRPISRTDPDWIGTQTVKIQHLFDLTRERCASAILHGGDLFHQPRGPNISRRVDQWLSRLLNLAPCPILAIPGNHDMQGHHLDSLQNHPYGCLEASGVIQSVIWPKYTLVGQDPLILITGKEYVPEGSGSWLEELREYRALYFLKKTLQDQYQVPVFTVAMSHGFWSGDGGTHFGEPMIPYESINKTGIDILIFGHDHSCNGVHPVETDEGFKYVVGPGAFVRGTLGEVDLRREPKIVLMTLDSSGNHEVILVTVPHAHADTIFDINGYQEKKKREIANDMFIEECRTLKCDVPTIEVILNTLDQAAVVSPNVIPLTWEYLIRAKEEI